MDKLTQAKITGSLGDDDGQGVSQTHKYLGFSITVYVCTDDQLSPRKPYGLKINDGSISWYRTITQRDTSMEFILLIWHQAVESALAEAAAEHDQEQAKRAARVYSMNVELFLNTPADLRAWLPSDQVTVQVVYMKGETVEECIQNAKARALSLFIEQLHKEHWNPNNWEKVIKHLNSGKVIVGGVSKVSRNPFMEAGYQQAMAGGR